MAYDDYEENKSSNTFGLILLAAAAGAVAGMLLAPKRGSETREEIKNRYNKLKNKTQDRALDAKDRFDRGIDAARSKAHDLADKSKDIADDAADRAKDASDKVNDRIKETSLVDEIQAVHAKRRGRPEA